MSNELDALASHPQDTNTEPPAPEGQQPVAWREGSPGAPTDDDGSMTPEEVRLENLKQMAAYSGPVVSFEWRDPYYLASCDHCGWVGSTELCGTDSFGDDSDVYCPRCHASGADSGKVASRIAEKMTRGGTLPPLCPNPAAQEMTEAGLPQFKEWFRKNYPGPYTIVHDPDWHAPKVYRAALKAAMEAGG